MVHCVRSPAIRPLHHASATSGEWSFPKEGPVPKFVEKAKRAYSLGGSTTRPPDEPGGQTEEEYAHEAVYPKSAGEESAIGVESGDRGALGSRSLDRGPAGEGPGSLGDAV